MPTADQLVSQAAFDLEQGRLDRAREALETALQLEPSDAEAWGLLGCAYERTGRCDDACNAYQRCISLDETEWEAAVALARLCLRGGELARARAMLLWLLMNMNESEQATSVRHRAQALLAMLPEGAE